MKLLILLTFCLGFVACNPDPCWSDPTCLRDAPPPARGARSFPEPTYVLKPAYVSAPEPNYVFIPPYVLEHEPAPTYNAPEPAPIYIESEPAPTYIEPEPEPTYVEPVPAPTYNEFDVLLSIRYSIYIARNHGSIDLSQHLIFFGLKFHSQFATHKNVMNCNNSRYN